MMMKILMMVGFLLVAGMPSAFAQEMSVAQA
jgi:hypothetical protein